MISNKTVYALIPARGGSKGIPDKCLTPLCTKPLIAYTIEQSLKSKYLDRIVVSTDSETIANVAREYKADVPFIRPAELAADDSSTVDVIVHSLEYFNTKKAGIPEIVMLLQPTSPLRIVEDIDKSLELFVESDTKSLVSLYKPDTSPYWFKYVDERGFVSDFISQPDSYVRRQDTNNLFLLNGAIYIFYSQSFLSGKILLTSETIPYIMPPERSIDIDTMLDLQFAEFLIKRTQH